MVNIARLTIWSIYCSRGGGWGTGRSFDSGAVHWRRLEVGPTVVTLHSYSNGNKSIGVRWTQGILIKKTAVKCIHLWVELLLKKNCSDVDIFSSLFNVQMETFVRCKWRKMIKEARWSGWVWVGECSFWYRPTRVVPDQRPLNGRCCCCCLDNGSITEHGQKQNSLTMVHRI